MHGPSATSRPSRREPAATQRLHRAHRDPGGRPAPARVRGRHHAADRVDDQHWQAVGRLDADQHARLERGRGVRLRCAGPGRLEHRRTVNLLHQAQAAAARQPASDTRPGLIARLERPGREASLETVHEARHRGQRRDEGRAACGMLPERLAAARSPPTTRRLLHCTQWQSPHRTASSPARSKWSRSPRSRACRARTPRASARTSSPTPDARSDPERRLAARLAAKRAALRLLGGASPSATSRSPAASTGRPVLRLSAPAAERLAALGATRALVSLTHERSHAAALVVLLRDA